MNAILGSQSHDPDLPSRINLTFPAELMARNQWVLWRYEPNQKDPEGKPRKVPYCTHGGHASVTNESTWTTFEKAAAAYRTGRYSGIGFVFSENDEYCGIDFDHCRDPATGILTPRVQALIKQLDSYTEVSPSGSGLHSIVKARLVSGRKTSAMELYERSRYFTVTGRHVEGSPCTVNLRQAEVDDLLSTLTPTLVNKSSADHTAAQPVASNTPSRPDEEIIAIILASEDKDRFTSLFSGGLQDFPGKSHSELDLALIGILTRHIGCHRDQIDRIFRRSTLMRPKWDEMRGATTYGQRTIAVSLTGIESDVCALHLLNETYAIVPVGNSIFILQKYVDHKGNESHRLLDQSHFTLMLANKPSIGGKPASKAWMKSPDRRQYKGIVFSPKNNIPDYFNTWRESPVKAKPGNCGLFLNFMLEVICNNNTLIYEYLLRYIAHMIQKPGEIAEVAIVLMGGQGTGKNTFVDTIGKLVGRHYRTAQRMDQLTDKFNSDFEHALLMHANEATWGGKKADGGVLKSMITDRTISIQLKGRDRYEIDNFVRIFISSNEKWPVQMDADDRRILALQLSDKRKQDHGYFTAIHAEIDSGGLEALMHYFSNLDITGFHPRMKPASPYAWLLKKQGMDSTSKFLFKRLYTGDLNFPLSYAQINPASSPARGATLRYIDMSVAYKSYCDFCHSSGDNHPEQIDDFFKTLRSILGRLIIKRSYTDSNGMNIQMIRFGPVAACRKRFERYMNCVGLIPW